MRRRSSVSPYVRVCMHSKGGMWASMNENTSACTRVSLHACLHNLLARDRSGNLGSASRASRVASYLCLTREQIWCRTDWSPHPSATQLVQLETYIPLPRRKHVAERTIDRATRSPRRCNARTSELRARCPAGAGRPRPWSSPRRPNGGSARREPRREQARSVQQASPCALAEV